jgi:hypothetical protein
MEGWAPQPPANPRVPTAPSLVTEVPRVACRGQPGWRWPVLTKPTGAGAGKHGPAGPRAPAGVRGRGSGGGEPRRPRRRTPGGAANPVLRCTSAPPAKGAGAAGGMWLLVQGPPLPAGTGSVSASRGSAFRVLPKAADSVRKRNGMVRKGQSAAPYSSAYRCPQVRRSAMAVDSSEIQTLGLPRDL